MKSDKESAWQHLSRWHAGVNSVLSHGSRPTEHGSTCSRVEYECISPPPEPFFKTQNIESAWVIASETKKNAVNIHIQLETAFYNIFLPLSVYVCGFFYKCRSATLNVYGDMDKYSAVLCVYDDLYTDCTIILNSLYYIYIIKGFMSTKRFTPSHLHLRLCQNTHSETLTKKTTF